MLAHGPLVGERNETTIENRFLLSIGGDGGQMSPFELFDRGSHVNHMSVNIQYGTRITFSKLCLEHLNCEKVLYLYDQSANLAAIMPCDAANRNGYTLHKNEAQAYVSARTFIQFIKAPDGKRDAKWIDGKIQFPIVIEEQP